MADKIGLPPHLSPAQLKKIRADLAIEKDLSNPILIDEINANKALIYEQEDSEVVA